ncbi:MAG: hypothetical protein UT05_C0005G0019 [Parcubacteria group bacterium GW2011_GWF2_38_76]|nr:MAG: hypothetical protein UT05_C0005G0019 [Parcubacteria group bacterium GW2011_GWF2_38_76]HBM45589.1 hypothetical protein [Patescibacteria group bacterium]
MEGELKEILELTKENNKILRGMRSSQRWNSFFNFVYYFLIIGSVVGSYYYLQPYIDTALQSYQSIMSGVQGGANGIKDINVSPEMLNQVKKTLNL